MPKRLKDIKECREIVIYLKTQIQIKKHKITNNLATLEELYHFLADIEERL